MRKFILVTIALLACGFTVEANPVRQRSVQRIKNVQKVRQAPVIVQRQRVVIKEAPVIVQEVRVQKVVQRVQQVYVPVQQIVVRERLVSNQFNSYSLPTNTSINIGAQAYGVVVTPPPVFYVDPRPSVQLFVDPCP